MKLPTVEDIKNIAGVGNKQRLFGMYCSNELANHKKELAKIKDNPDKKSKYRVMYLEAMIRVYTD